MKLFTFLLAGSAIGLAAFPPLGLASDEPGTPLEVLFAAGDTPRDPLPPGPATPPPAIGALSRAFTLVGTFVAADGASYAILTRKDRDGGEQLLVRPGSRLALADAGPGDPGLARVQGIHRTWISLSPPVGPPQRIDLDLELSPAPSAAPRSRGRGTESAGIQRIAPHRIQIDGPTRDRHLANLPALLRTARAMPEHADGVLRGFRLVSIQAHSVLTELGLAEGDLLTTVDGRALDDRGALAGLLHVLRGRRSVNLGLERDGVSIDIRYEIGPGAPRA